MSKKIISLSAILSLLMFLGPSSSAVSAPAKVDYVLPEQAGTYDVPGRPDLKLKVFVYHGKNDAADQVRRGGKPVPPEPTLTCVEEAIGDPGSASVVSAAGWK